MRTKRSSAKTRQIYDFIKANGTQFDVRTMCRALEVAPSGYYAWLQEPISNRAREDARLLRLIRASFVASQGIYGSSRVFLDLREAGETCSKWRARHCGCYAAKGIAVFAIRSRGFQRSKSPRS